MPAWRMRRRRRAGDGLPLPALHAATAGRRAATRGRVARRMTRCAGVVRAWTLLWMALAGVGECDVPWNLSVRMDGWPIDQAADCLLSSGRLRVRTTP